MNDVRLMTYDEIADAWSITRESARQLVIRKRWTRTKGNDQRARVEVPVDAIENTRASDAAASPPSDDTGHTPSDDTGDHPAVIAISDVLTKHIARIEAELVEARSALTAVTAERDADRLRAVQIEGLRAVLEAERNAARAATERAEAERDRWHAAATAPRGLAALLGRLRRA
jgi:hypothetical protein